MLRPAAPFDFAAMPATPENYHTSVLPEETVRFLLPAPGKVLFDGTLGGGGHSEAHLEAFALVVGRHP